MLTDLLQFGFLPACNEDASTILHESLRRNLTQSRRTSCDERDVAGEIEKARNAEVCCRGHGCMC